MTTSEATDVVSTTSASARGSNAEQWVLSQRPSGTIAFTETDRRTATAEFSARWEVRTANQSSTQGTGYTTTVEVVTSGGRRAVRLRPIAGGFPPIVQRGAFQPYTAEVSVTVQRQGGSGLASELPFPPELAAPWILDAERSRFGEPVITERATDPNQHRWERRGSFVYVSATAPAQSPSVELSQANAVQANPLV